MKREPLYGRGLTPGEPRIAVTCLCGKSLDADCARCSPPKARKRATRAV